MELGRCLHCSRHTDVSPRLTITSSQFFQTPHCERLHTCIICTTVLTRCTVVALVIVCTRMHRGLGVYMTDFNEYDFNLSAIISLLSSARSGSQSIYQHRQRPSEFEFATPLQVNVRRTVRIDVESEYSPCESISRPTSGSYTSHHSSKPSQPGPPSTSN